VRNPTSIPRNIQFQLFQRSFSTKGSDRGLGTYSMRLLGERYLGGAISFRSGPPTGTEFRLALPPAAPSRDSEGERPLGAHAPQGMLRPGAMSVGSVQEMMTWPHSGFALDCGARIVERGDEDSQADSRGEEGAATARGNPHRRNRYD
jgi:hypothetical protein